MPSHSRTGFSNALPGETLYDMGILNPFKYHLFSNDFDSFTAANWTVTETQAGATQAINTGADGGILELVNSAADDDLNAIQMVNETFKWEAGQDMFFYARLKVSDATQSDVVIGLQITDTTPLAVTDGLFFLKSDGSTTISFLAEKNSTATTTAVGTVVSDTYFTIGFFYSAMDGLFHLFFNDAETGTSVTTNAVDDEELTISIALQNGDANARTLSVDYVLAAKGRGGVWS